MTQPEGLFSIFIDRPFLHTNDRNEITSRDQRAHDRAHRKVTDFFRKDGRENEGQKQCECGDDLARGRKINTVAMGRSNLWKERVISNEYQAVERIEDEQD